MLGCEIDFIIKGLDNSSRSVVASRKDVMYKKRQILYLPDAGGNSRVYEDRVVQTRVIAVAEKVVRVEIFGVECSILARNLSWDWLGDATESFFVGEQILVRILHVKLNSLQDISVKADVKSVNGNTSKANLGKCRIQGKYAGIVTDIHKGTVFVRLHIGVNAVAHSCYDNRMTGKKDEISFVVTRIDEERTVAVGLESGMAAGKTETELCNELGSPKELAHSLLLDKSSNNFRHVLLCVHIISCFILCLLVFRYPSPLFVIITLLIIPISIWHLEGGYCLFQIRSDTTKHYKVYSIFFTISLLLISIEQFFTILLKNNISISIPVIKTTFYVSSIFIIISLAILITAIYKLYKGYYLSDGILIISLGAICSSLLYNDYLKRFISPTTTYNICSLPFLLSVLMGVLYYWKKLKKKDKNLWIHR